jgi:hypothetical protein
LCYLVDHPRAKDTAEGIMQWWLDDKSIGRMDVERSLSLLVSRGLIRETRRNGASPYYQLISRRKPLALRTLKEL